MAKQGVPKGKNKAQGKKVQDKKAQNKNPQIKKALDKKQQVKEQFQAEWLFLTGADNSIRKIADVLEGDYKYEIWEEAAIIEMALSKEASVDFEEVEVNEKDELLLSKMEQEKAARNYLVTAHDADEKTLKALFQKLLVELGGAFYADTEDLEPSIHA